MYIAVVLLRTLKKPPTSISIATSQFGLSPRRIALTPKPNSRDIGQQLGVDEAIGELLPEQKLDKIREILKQGSKAAMVGDGINDAPALAEGTVGIAMGEERTWRWKRPISLHRPHRRDSASIDNCGGILILFSAINLTIKPHIRDSKIPG